MEAVKPTGSTWDGRSSYAFKCHTVDESATFWKTHSGQLLHASGGITRRCLATSVVLWPDELAIPRPKGSTRLETLGLVT